MRLPVLLEPEDLWEELLPVVLVRVLVKEGPLFFCAVGVTGLWVIVFFGVLTVVFLGA